LALSTSSNVVFRTLTQELLSGKKCNAASYRPVEYRPTELVVTEIAVKKLSKEELFFKEEHEPGRVPERSLKTRSRISWWL
jgi:hypothetical protein